MTGLLAALCGASIAGGLMLLATARRPAAAGQPARARLPRPGWRVPRTRLVAAVCAAVAVGLLTGWPAAGVLAAAAAVGLPAVLTGSTAAAVQVARVEAIAGWAEMLRDTLSAAAGLEQAIVATAPLAPEPIREPVEGLVRSLGHGTRLAPALRATADRLADPTADLVLIALVLAAERQSRDLAGLLGSLATAARAQAGMRLRIAAGRARTRTSVRIVTGGSLAMAAGLTVLDRPYLSPYSSPVGQLILLAVGGLFAAAYMWLARISRPQLPGRVLTRPPGSQPAEMA